MSPIVKAVNLTRRLQGEVPVTLVEDVNLTFDAGEFAIVSGPSGSGKSSLLYLLGLLDMPTGGAVYLDGKDTARMSENELADMRLEKIGFVFQFHFLLPEFSALENVMLPMQRLGRHSVTEQKRRAGSLLEQLGLAEHLHKRPKQLSGGQSQRVAIARALANDPRLILADEPTGNLDTASSANVQQILRTMATEHGRAVITVTHDPTFGVETDRMVRIVDGRIV